MQNPRAPRIIGIRVSNRDDNIRQPKKARTRRGNRANLRAFAPLREIFSAHPTGNSTVNVLPCPGVLSTPTRPPNDCARCFTIESPSPVPPSSRERALSTR